MSRQAVLARHKTAASTATVFGCASVLLSYPDEGFAEDLNAVGETIGSPGRSGARAHLAAVHKWLSAMGLHEAQERYVETFDLARRRTLYLTYYSHGDMRTRGLALAELVDQYRSAGVVPAPGELPDFLPMLLELASIDRTGVTILSGFRFALDALAESIEKSGSTYARAIRAVTEALGPRTRFDLQALRKFRSAGPPSESVGMEPFAPPEYLGMSLGPSATMPGPAPEGFPVSPVGREDGRQVAVTIRGRGGR